MINPQINEVIVIGSGPAGYTAAIYLARAELKPLVLAGEASGGQLMLTTEVENFPGFKAGVMGPDLVLEMREQAERFGAEVIDKDVVKVDFQTKPFKVWIGGSPSTAQNVTSSGRAQDDKPNYKSLSGLSGEGGVYGARAVIIATGAKSRLLGVPGEKKFMGRGVSTCAVCDAAFYKGKTQTLVVGGGDAAMEEALALSKFAKKVTVVHRRDELRASKAMQEKVRAKGNIEYLFNSEVIEIKGIDPSAGSGQVKATSAVIKNNQTGEQKELPMDGIFIAIGHVPATGIFKGQVELDKKGYVKTGITCQLNSKFQIPNSKLWLEGYPTMTSVEGVFAAGDAVDFRYRQAVTAAGWGTMAALDVEGWLERK